MKSNLSAIALTLVITGCQSAPEVLIDATPPEINDVAREYPQVTFAKLSVPAGAQTLTAANKLADELGVEFVEWATELNPYEYHQLRSKRVNLNFEEPQKAFLELFDRSGLLAHFDEATNAVTIYPFSMESRVAAPHIFTPKFERSAKQTAQIIEAHEDKLVSQRKVIEYHYYEGYTVQETINAWAKQANYSGVVWYLNDQPDIEFTQAVLPKTDSNIGQSSLVVMNNFLTDEAERQSMASQPLTLVVDASKNLLIVHPFARTEIVRAFEIEPSSVKYNLQNIAQFYGYDLDYRAQDYGIPTSYITVLSSFVEKSVKTVVQQYPLDIEVVDSTKKIIVRGKNNA